MEIKELAEMATKKGICSPGLQRILASMDKESLLQYYIEGIDFCLEHDFPSKEYLIQVGGELLPKFGIHVDEKCTLINRERIVLLGQCEASIANSSYAVSDIYIKHSSKAKVFVSDHSFIRLDCFDDSEVYINCEGDAKVLVNVYGNSNVKYQTSGNARIKIINKGKEKYE